MYVLPANRALSTRRLSIPAWDLSGNPGCREQNDRVMRMGFGIHGDRVQGFDGLVKIMNMQCNELYVTDPVPSEAKGTPRLVLQQLDENAERTAGKVIVVPKSRTPGRSTTTGGSCR
jgi:hypothetical protein